MLPFDTRTRYFKGKPLTTLVFDGLPAWVARHIGALLDYPGHGKRLVHKILGEWNAEFEEGHDYFFLEGADLAALRAIGADGPILVSHHARDSLLVLLEPGLHLVLEKTRRPPADKLRRFLLDEVLEGLPDYQPGDLADGVELQTRVRLSEGTFEARIAPPLSERQESRLLLEAQTQDKLAELAERRFQSSAVQRFLERFGRTLEPSVLLAFELWLAEIATGRDLLPLLGPPDDDDNDSPMAEPIDEQAA